MSANISSNAASVEKVTIQRKSFFGSGLPSSSSREEEEKVDYALGIAFGDASGNDTTSGSILEVNTLQPVWSTTTTINNYCRNDLTSAAISSQPLEPNSTAATNMNTEGTISASSTNEADTPNSTSNSTTTTTTAKTIYSYAPLYSYDDPTIPTEADLGLFETKEAQNKSMLLRQEEERIEHLSTNQNVTDAVFGALACPSPSDGMDDSRRWFGRSYHGKDRDVHLGSGGVGKEGDILRYGWWNHSLPEEDTLKRNKCPPLKDQSYHYNTSDAITVSNLLPPTSNYTTTPSLTTIQDNNLSLQHIHPSQKAITKTPYLSDRNPATKYIQIETQGVGFPLKAEIEPFFCSLCIYHVNPSNNNSSKSLSDTSSSSTSISSDQYRQSGRITESLNFDLINDTSVEKLFQSSLGSTETQDRTNTGVFPIPSTLSIHSLYAVLIVRKVISSSPDNSTSDPYNPSSSSSLEEEELDIAKLQKQAKFKSKQTIKEPFCFGVAPLSYLISSSTSNKQKETNQSPKEKILPTPVSRAMQIPLFTYNNSSLGGGEDFIMDHIVRLYQSPPPAGTTPVSSTINTKGGLAMLILRYYGYLGIHSVIDDKYQMYKHRLVDFTCERQVVRTTDSNRFKADSTINGGRNINTLLIEGQNNQNPKNYSYVQELAPIPLSITSSINAFRTTTAYNPNTNSPSDKEMNTTSNQNTTTCTQSKLLEKDIEPMFYTSYSNELLLHLRMLHILNTNNITPLTIIQENLVIQIDLRLILQDTTNPDILFAIPYDTSMIHSTKRGDYLTSKEYSSEVHLSSSKKKASFLQDEFKIKLPLVLNDSLCFFFTLLSTTSTHQKKNQSSSSTTTSSSTFTKVMEGKVKKKKSRFGLPTPSIIKSKSKSKHNSIVVSTPCEDQSVDTTSKEEEEEEEPMAASLKFVSCGFLPLSISNPSTNNTTASSNYLLHNDLHDVELKYCTVAHSDDQDLPDGTLILTPSNSNSSSSSSSSSVKGNTVLNPTTNLDHVPTHNDEEGSTKVTTTAPTPTKSNTTSIESNDKKGNHHPHHMLASTNMIITPSTTTIQPDMVSSSSSFSSDEQDNTEERSITTTTDPCQAQPQAYNFTKPLKKHAQVQQQQTQEDTIILQVRTISLSSIHVQNPILSSFLTLSNSILPKKLSSFTLEQKQKLKDVWNNSYFKEKKMDSMIGIIPYNMMYPSILSKEEQELVSIFSMLSKPMHVPPHETTMHLLRILFHLWRMFLIGTTISNEEQILHYANPAAFIPIRLHAFTTLLTILNLVTSYQSKCGMTLLDGKGRWDLSTMGKIVSLLFDEDVLFSIENDDEDVGGGNDDEPIRIRPTIGLTSTILDTSSSTQEEEERIADSKLKEEIKPKHHSFHRRRMKQQQLQQALDTDTSNESSLENTITITDNIDYSAIASSPTKTNEKESYSSTELSSDQFRQLLNQTIHTNDYEDDDDFTLTTKADDDEKTSSSSKTFEKKIDSKFDFQNALNRFTSDSASTIAYTPTTDNKSSSNNSKPKSGKNVALAMINCYGSGGGAVSSRRKWMTAPTSITSFGLATIQENDNVLDRSAILEEDEGEDEAHSHTSDIDDDSITFIPKDKQSSKIKDDITTTTIDTISTISTTIDISSSFISKIDDTTNNKEAQALIGLDTELIHTSRRRPKQMRIPRSIVRSSSDTSNDTTNVVDVVTTLDKAFDDSGISSPTTTSTCSTTTDITMISALIPNTSTTSLMSQEQPIITIDDNITTVPTTIDSTTTSSSSTTTALDSYNSTNVVLNNTTDSNNTTSSNTKSKNNKPTQNNKTAQSDDELEAAGTAFLDVIGKNLGYNLGTKDMAGEERGVGFAHHRKTRSHSRSHCSIDWTLPPIDLLMDSHQQQSHKPYHLDDDGNHNSIFGRQLNKHSDKADSSVAGKDIPRVNKQHDEYSPDHIFSNTTDNLNNNENSSSFQTTASKNIKNEQPISTLAEMDIDTISLTINDSRSPTFTKQTKDHDTNNLPFIFPSTTNENITIATIPSNDESSSDKDLLQLRGFSDRMNAFDDNMSQKQWFPYTYEVVIYQWLALLLEQSKNNSPVVIGMNNTTSSNEEDETTEQHDGTPPPFVTQSLSETGAKSKGITIGCAPILFEIMKKSLANRIYKITQTNAHAQAFLEKRQNNSRLSSPKSGIATTISSLPYVYQHPCFTLDSNIIHTLERLITIITDACIDSRNFDTRIFRQSSIDVNDSIVRFIRDLFGYLDIGTVHRLLMVYFSRFVTKEGKVWQDRDSRLGVRVSWEVCKLRLNSVTLLIRFPDFVRVNLPIMENNTWNYNVRNGSKCNTPRFFDKALDEIEKLGSSSSTMPNLADNTNDGPMLRTITNVDIPTLKPHWLVELVTDLLLSASEHAEQLIQHRASSLLYELFWSHSKEGKMTTGGNNNKSSIIASMYVPFISKVSTRLNYLSSLPPKSQLRKDILPCIVFVLQSAPVELLRALWRKLIKNSDGMGNCCKFLHIISSSSPNTANTTTNTEYKFDKPSILDIYCLLNLVIKTFEYDGCDNDAEDDVGTTVNEQHAAWEKEFLISEETTSSSPSSTTASPSQSNNDESKRFTTTTSRKWHAHDGAIVVIRTSRYIVNEVLCLLFPTVDRPSSAASFDMNNGSSGDGTTSVDDNNNNNTSSTTTNTTHYHSKRSLAAEQLNRISFNSTSSLSSLIGERYNNNNNKYSNNDNKPYSRQQQAHLKTPLEFTAADIIVFARAATSLYLHTLALRQSDVVIVKTLTATVEVLKIFGIKVFLASVGETLQHWLRVILIHCGARRASVRVQALEFLALLLRLTWECYGSFSRMRVPLLAVQTEVMERIVAIAATRHYREYRRLGIPVEFLTNNAAEATLAPLWRTLDRLHNQSASQNIAFRTAVTRLAEAMKKLYRAYIAAHALAYASRKRADMLNGDLSSSAIIVATPSMHKLKMRLARIVSASSGLSKQFLAAQSGIDVVIHNEAVEDAFLAAADVFSPTELPSHRIAWLRKLADFHASLNKFAEEGTSRFNIFCTLRQAALLYDSIWSSTPFLPWAIETSDGGMHLDGEGPAGIIGDLYDSDYIDLEEFYRSDAENYDPSKVNDVGKQIEKNNFLRRMFYRVANSVRMRTGDWNVCGNKNLFYGVTAEAEYNFVSPWISLREIEEEMVEEIEAAGELYLKAGAVESSRTSWSIAAQIYSEAFNYQRLSYVYRRLSMVVASLIPPVDTSNPFELSTPLGRYYRVWFHGGAPDELVGAEFVYRAKIKETLVDFGKRISDMLKSLLPVNTPIDLVLDDGKPEEPKPKRPKKRIGGPPIDPVKIKVTPLRAIIQREGIYRGSLEWFYNHIEHSGHTTTAQTFRNQTPQLGQKEKENSVPRHRAGRGNDSPRSYSMSNTSVISVASSSSGRIAKAASGSNGSSATGLFLNAGTGTTSGGPSLMGVDKFSFTQPIEKDRQKGAASDWLKTPADAFADKSLRVIQLQVEQCFPACVSRQAVNHRAVFNQSPLEAAVEAVCSWCAALYRTLVATSGSAVLGAPKDQGIGTGASKVVAACIHSCKVKDIAQNFLQRFSKDHEMNSIDLGATVVLRYGKLSEEEVFKNQSKLARGVVIFMELLHILLVRNRDTLLSVVQSRRTMKEIPSSKSQVSDSVTKEDTSSFSGRKSMNRTDAAIAVQSELQRSFIALARTLHPLISNTIGGETPRWLKLACHDGYFSSGTYRQTRISMGDELYYGDNSPQSNNAFIEDRYNDPSPKSTPFSSSTPDGGNSYDGTISVKSFQSNLSSSQSNRRSVSTAQPSTLPLPIAARNRHLVSLNEMPVAAQHNYSSSF